MIEPLYGGTLSDSVSLGDNRNPRLPRQHPQQVWAWQGRHYGQPEGLDRLALFLAKTEHSHPLGMVVSTHFRCGKGVKRGLKNGALPFTSCEGV